MTDFDDYHDAIRRILVGLDIRPDDELPVALPPRAAKALLWLGIMTGGRANSQTKTLILKDTRVPELDFATGERASKLRELAKTHAKFRDRTKGDVALGISAAKLVKKLCIGEEMGPKY